MSYLKVCWLSHQTRAIFYDLISAYVHMKRQPYLLVEQTQILPCTATVLVPLLAAQNAEQAAIEFIG